MKPIDKEHQFPLVRLEGMQSVRTTFQFSKGTQAALDYLKKRLKITTKEIFDKSTQLLAPEFANILADILKNIAANAKTEPTGARKTWVISKTTLFLVNKTAKAMGISRDSLVEGSIQLLDVLATVEYQKRPENHKKALEMVKKFWYQAEDVNKELVDLLGEEDPIIMRFVDVLSILDMLSQAIEAEIEQGIPVGPDF